MNRDTQQALRHRWFPVCSRIDLPARHVFETDLLGEELAIWRGTNGAVNVWENRCPHRGMRLTVGVNLGDELRCAYHGYRFAQGSGACTSIPAQPGRAPPQSLCVRSFRVREAGNLVWTRLDDPGPDDGDSGLALISGASVVLHRVFVNATVSTIGRQLSSFGLGLPPVLIDGALAVSGASVIPMDEYCFRSVVTNASAPTEIRLYLQPVDAGCTALHGLFLGEVPAAHEAALLRHYAHELMRLRDACETAPAATNAQLPFTSEPAPP